MTKLKISPTLSLPTDAVTSTIVVYGGKGMGKTNLASVLVEEFAAAHLRFAVIDPMGVWWGLRHSASGKGAGVKALILGGIHGDMPITPESGVIVADLVVDEDASVIIDISRRPDGSMWAIAERVRFVTDYAKRLYQRQGEKRRPIHQVIDEAARFVPQMIRAGDLDVAKCMGAVAVIVEEGRNVGIGVTLVTQRSARLNKDVAELADCMIAFRTLGPNSMDAVLDWLGEHVEKARLKEIGAKLRELPRGSALVVSPGWLQFEGVVAMRKRETFDSSKTPEAGKEVRASGAGSKPDLEKYRARMAEVIEQAKANDPKALKARVAELEKQLAAKRAPAHAKTERVEVPAIKDAELKRLERMFESMKSIQDRVEKVTQSAIERIEAIAGTLDDQFDGVVDTLRSVDRRLAAHGPSQPTNRELAAAHFAGDGKVTKQVGKHQIRVPKQHTNGTSLPVGEAATLRALIQYTSGLRREQLTVLTGYKRSTRDAYIARLRDRGLVDVQGDRVIVTREGVQTMPDAEPLPTGHALQDYWLERLPSGEGAILAALLEARGAEESRDSLSERTGFKRSTRDAYLSRLAAKELVVDAGRGFVKASPTLFEVSP